MASFDDKARQFIIAFPSNPSLSSPAATVTKSILVDQFLVIHTPALLVVD